MIKQLWINLPVKNAERSKEFFIKMGFKLNEHYSNSNSASLIVGEKNIVLMLFEEAAFKGFTGSGIADVSQSAEVLFSIDAESKEEVDEMARKAIAAGGSSNHKPSEMQGFMYGCLFMDPDGHRWNVLYMDMSKMPK